MKATWLSSPTSWTGRTWPSVAILIRDGWRSWHYEILGGLIPTEFGDAPHSICLAMARFKSHPKFLDCAFSLVDLPKGVACYNDDGNFTRRTLHRKRTGRRPHLMRQSGEHICLYL